MHYNIFLKVIMSDIDTHTLMCNSHYSWYSVVAVDTDSVQWHQLENKVITLTIRCSDPMMTEFCVNFEVNVARRRKYNLILYAVMSHQ